MLKFTYVAFRVRTCREITRPKRILVLLFYWEKIFLEVLELDIFISDLRFNG